ncbi:hypothetical protein [Maritimibacter sp. UBA3975]|uniref:hypothetical protein n=1 Tax=Maritimibacter sp. UBA3975 TaxID=1946833 RepID=UPI000C0B49B6|nr:hypothetical protein [Maritimibacter sp. UBA3975]MAM61186.1 hypothetical protein [Maritimibacter sp.]|tara:strand:+ start:11894 stop:12310 length:417 start_codon:yes stop_codon:yes gene_type:complete
MPVQFRILPEINLTYVEYTGRMVVQESVDVFRAYLRHPDFRPGQKHLIDLSGVTDWERDYAEIMSMQAMTAEGLYDPAHPTVVVAVAPTKMTRTVANLVNRTWDRVNGVRFLAARSEEEALELLGLPARVHSEIFGTA